MAPTLPAPPVLLSKVGRAAHDIGLAGLLGGNLFGRLAMHPSVTEIADQAERGKVVNAAWRRYDVVNSLSMVAATGLGTAAEGVRFAWMAPGGAVPLQDGDHAAPAASERARRSKRRVNILSTANLLSEIALGPDITGSWRRAEKEERWTKRSLTCRCASSSSSWG